jgi:hypothetical protein
MNELGYYIKWSDANKDALNLNSVQVMIQAVEYL